MGSWVGVPRGYHPGGHGVEKPLQHHILAEPGFAACGDALIPLLGQKGEAAADKMLLLFRTVEELWHHGMAGPPRHVASDRGRVLLAGSQARVWSCSVGPVPLALSALSWEHWGRCVWLGRGVRLRVPRQASPWHDKLPVLARGGDGSEITALHALLAQQGPALLPSHVPSRGRVSVPSCLVASGRRLAPYPCMASHVRAGAPAQHWGFGCGIKHPRHWRMLRQEVWWVDVAVLGESPGFCKDVGSGREKPEGT